MIIITKIIQDEESEEEKIIFFQKSMIRKKGSFYEPNLENSIDLKL